MTKPLNVAEPLVGPPGSELPDTVTVRYFAGARAATGVAAEQVAAPGPLPLPDLLERLGRRHGPGLTRVLAVSSFLVDEVPGSRDRVVPAGAVVDVLPPFAGG